MSEDGLEVARLTIIRTLGKDDSDSDTVRVLPSDGLGMLEALGMIELSKDILITTQMFTIDDEDDDEA